MKLETAQRIVSEALKHARAKSMKPLAVVVVGGMMLAPAVILITLPVLILLFSRRAARPAPQQAVPAPVE